MVGIKEAAKIAASKAPNGYIVAGALESAECYLFDFGLKSDPDAEPDGGPPMLAVWKANGDSETVHIPSRMWLDILEQSAEVDFEV